METKHRKIVNQLAIFLRRLSNGHIPKYVNQDWDGMCGAVYEFLCKYDNRHKCDTAKTVFPIFMGTIHNCVDGWEYYSRIKNYPIKMNDTNFNGDARRAFYDKYELHKWQGEYGRRRMILCGIVADALKEKLEGK